jgi:acetylglutamate kinase
MKKVLVIKVGGAFMHNSVVAVELLSVLKQLKHTHQFVLVHGGGPMVEELTAALGFTTQKLDGLRVTPKEQLPFVVGALAGTANKQLCAFAIKAGLSPVGLSLADGGMCRCSMIKPELGAVGQATAGNSDLLKSLTEQHFLPVISSIGADDEGNLLNVNADQAAIVVAQLLSAELILLSDVAGVLDEQKQLISQLEHKTIDQLITQNIIRDGMAVKVRAALDTANAIHKPVYIASWKQPQSLLALAKGQPVGTQVLPKHYSQTLEQKSS